MRVAMVLHFPRLPVPAPIAAWLAGVDMQPDPAFRDRPAMPLLSALGLPEEPCSIPGRESGSRVVVPERHGTAVLVASARTAVAHGTGVDRCSVVSDVASMPAASLVMIRRSSAISFAVRLAPMC